MYNSDSLFGVREIVIINALIKFIIDEYLAVYCARIHV